MKIDCRAISVSIAFLYLAGCVTQGAPELKNLEDVARAYVENFNPAAKKGKIIYIGVYGGELPSGAKAEGFDPQRWPAYQKVDAFNDKDLSEIAFKESLLNAVGLRIARQFPSSVTLIVRGDGEAVANMIQHFYAAGDRVYLVGFSNGGGAVIDAAYRLKKQDIPIRMTAQIDSIGSGNYVPGNVSRAFNFYSVDDFFCPGKKKMVAEDPGFTQVANEEISKPQGPFAGGFCAVHRNMDSDPRVWKAILDYIIRFESALETQGEIQERQRPS